MIEMKNLSSLVTRLVEVAYPELDRNQIAIGWKRIASFATISWNQGLNDIKIKCSNETKKWHESALIGLLAHELSHPAQKVKSQSEQSTDLDVIERGLGLYLGVERLFAGKYEDYIIQKGKDRYLGYRSIRSHLTDTELKYLDILLTQLRIVPSMMINKSTRHHDIVIMHSSTNTIINIDGNKLELPLLDNPDIRVLKKGQSFHIFVNGEDFGTIEN